MMTQSRYEMAYEDLHIFLAVNPDDIPAQGLLAVCCINLKKYEEGEEVIQNSLYLQPWNGYLKYLLSNLYASQDKKKKALVAINEAIEMDSYNSEFFDLKSRLHLAKNQYVEAENAARESLAIDSQSEDALNSLSKALIGQNRGEEASAVMDKALETNPENWETHANYGYRSLELGKVKDAIEHFRNALINDPNKQFAQHGMKLAMKAKFPLYRWLIQIQFYMSKKGRQFNLFFIIGLVVLLNVLQKLQEGSSGMIRYGLMAMIGVLLLFVFSSWILDPIMNLVLYSNKNGRLSLDEDETNTAKFVGVNLIVAAIGLILFATTGNFFSLNLCGIGALGLLTASGMFEAYPAKARKLPRIFYIVGSSIFFLGVLGMVIGNYGFADMMLGAGMLVGVAYTWVGNSAFRREE